MTPGHQPQDVVRFWRDAGPDKWFDKDAAFDRDFSARFLDAHMAAARRELDRWLDGTEGALALLILLDQFPRNAFRGTAHMFATDPLALAFARAAVERGHDHAIDPALRVFFYLPFEHSEALADQDRAVALCEGLGDYARYARIHHDVIARFGRFPHRNAVLGRDSTAAERAFLDEGGFAG
ncbi:DUF924 family protein [Rhodanobacter aciditrophus]|uniref:DUF924 family protein n=1 Tax=Rhodanobacter aciditrophus TaxID=1623218 RepID=UPI003CF33A46